MVTKAALAVIRRAETWCEQRLRNTVGTGSGLGFVAALEEEKQ
jgi:hypothetical protein